MTQQPQTSESAPDHCGFPMWRVINRRTAVNAISREHDTIVYECSICGHIERIQGETDR